MIEKRQDFGLAIGPRHLAWATLFGIVVLAGVGAGLWWLMDRQAQEIDLYSLARTTVIAVAAIGAVPAGYIAYRRQRTQELQRHDERENADRATDDEFRDRYVDAAAQLGHAEAATRMAGVYSLAQLADEWGQARHRQFRQMCIDVLCAYLRIPYGPQQGSSGPRQGEKEVRRTMIRVIRDHLREDKVRDGVSWSDLSFSFEGAYFDCGDFTRACFAGDFVSFHRATFAGGTIHFDGATFATRAYFTDVQVASGVLRLNDARVGRDPRSGDRATSPILSIAGMQVARGARVERDGFTAEMSIDWESSLTRPRYRGLARVVRLLRRRNTSTLKHLVVR